VASVTKYKIVTEILSYLPEVTVLIVLNVYEY